MQFTSSAAVGVAVLTGALAAGSGKAEAIPIGWTCVGTCGTSGANGVVTAPPTGTTYEWVSTNLAGSNAGLGLGFNETNGSVLTTNQFQANAGEELVFYFNYVTSDGAGFPEYAWAQLVEPSNNDFLLFTARTAENEVDNTVPGVDMPPLGVGVTLAPPIVTITAGGPSWAPLGSSSGGCWDVGCGYTGWVQASYTIVESGLYRLVFGVVNVNDTAFDSGMAIAGATIAGDPITTDEVPTAVPEPATVGLIAFGLAGIAARRRRSKQ